MTALSQSGSSKSGSSSSSTQGSTSIIVWLNGEETRVSCGATVQAALQILDIDGESPGVAVALNSEVLPRAVWSSTELKAGAKIEVLTAAQGG